VLAEFGVQAGNVSFTTTSNYKAGSDFKRFKRLDHGSSGSRGYTRIIEKTQIGADYCLVLFCFGGWLVVSKRLDPGSSKLARDDTVYSLGVLVLGCVHHQHVTTTPPHHESSFSPFHLSTSKTPFHLSTSKTPFHLQRSCHPRSISFSPPHHDTTKSCLDIAIICSYKRLSYHP
jgi:hypothetical protein